jgi:hypothetical protein
MQRPVGKIRHRPSIKNLVALNALANVVTTGGSFNVARGDLSTPLIFVGHGMVGASLSDDSSQLSGGSTSVVGAYLGNVAENVPTDSSGKALPFFLLVSGSGNDASNTDAQVQAAASYVAQQIIARFPTASTMSACWVIAARIRT